MAVININKKTFEKEIGKLDEKMQEKIALFGTPVESLTPEELQLEIFPNRPDLLSYQGFKRSFLAFLGKKTGMKRYKINPPEKDYKVTIDKSVKDVRPFTSCAIVKGLKLDDEKIKEIIEIQEKLHITIGRKRKKVAIGIYPLEKIKLPITFKALEPDKIKFIPLEYERELTGIQILQRHSTGKEYSHLLAGKAKFPIFIDAEEQILSMPPIINSQTTGKITEKTKDVFVECSGFNQEILDKCLNIIVTTLADMGGTIYQIQIKDSPKKTTPKFETETMKVSLEQTKKVLGIELKEKEIKKLIEKMGYDFKKPNFIVIPSWRTDILHEVDLIEDIAIAYGYENFIPEIPSISTIGQEDKKTITKRKISEIISGLGFLEISNLHLTKEQDQFIKMGIHEREIKNNLKIADSKTEFDTLRQDLSHYALKILSENTDSEYPHKIFETGTIFLEENDKLKEKQRLCIALTPGNFTDIKQIIEYVFRMLGIEIEISLPDKTPVFLIPGRIAKIKIKDSVIGILGEVHPKIIKNWKIKMPVALAEIDLEEIFKELN